MNNKISNAVPFKISADGKVFWLHGKDIKFDQPMFNDVFTLGTSNHSFIQTDLTALIEMADGLYPVAPAGLIFHVGRCGSTMLSNAIRAVSGTLVLSEPGPINSLLQLFTAARRKLPLHANQENTALLIKSFIRILGATASDHENKIYLKFSSWNTLMMQQIRMIWPDIPVAFAFREPLDVLDSILTKNIGWMNFYDSHDFVSRLLNEEKKYIGKLPFIEFTALFLSAIYKSGLNLNDDDLLISYENDCFDNIEKLLVHFNIIPDDMDRIKIKEATRYYSKDKHKKTLFNTGQNIRNYELNARTEACIAGSGVHHTYQILQNKQRCSFKDVLHQGPHI